MKRRLLILLTALLISSQVGAHRELESLTTLTRNPRSHAIEVVHRIHQHDAQEVLNRLPGLERDARDIGTVKGQAHIALMVEQAFKINNKGQRVEMTLVGATLDADHLLVFQEFFQSSEQELTIRFSLFDDFFSNYISRVTLLLDGINKTVFFDSTLSEHKVVVPLPAS